MKQDFIVRHCPECGHSLVAGNRRQRFCCEKCNAAFYFQVDDIYKMVAITACQAMDSK